MELSLTPSAVLTRLVHFFPQELSLVVEGEDRGRVFQCHNLLGHEHGHDLLRFCVKLPDPMMQSEGGYAIAEGLVASVSHHCLFLLDCRRLPAH